MFEELIAKVARALNELGVDYMLIGGQAVLIHGEPRLTRDIDVTLGVDVGSLATIKEVAGAAGLKPLIADDSFVEETMVFPCIQEESGVRVDLVFSYSPYEREAIERAGTQEVGGEQVKFTTAEDLVIQKCVAGRARDLEDVRAVIAKNPALDRDYIERWLSEFTQVVEHDPLGQFRSLEKS